MVANLKLIVKTKNKVYNTCCWSLPSIQLGDSTMENMKFYELSEKIAKLMESYNMKIYDLEFINELIEKTIERNEKECSY